MKERPIIMTGNSPTAILDGSKTQTRRVIKNPTKLPIAVFSSNQAAQAYCPYGQVGDRLWVRETWATYGYLNRWKPSLLSHDEHIVYKATHEYPHQYTWRPSIYMPRWASRILLEITDIRVERLQEIKTGDIKKEGFPWISSVGAESMQFGYQPPRHWFSNLWDSLNAKRGYSWETNPWVWCLSFKIVK